MGLINRDSVLDVLAKQRASEPKHKRTIMRSIQLIVEQPIVDAVQVVRCKYCVHRRESDNWCGVIAAYCGNLDWFCADGEKRYSE